MDATQRATRLTHRLPSTFRHRDALEQMNERQFRLLLDQGAIIRLARGVYQRADISDDELGEAALMEIAIRAPRATLALRTALARHGLIDEIPPSLDIALPRGTWTPSAIGEPVTWHHFDLGTFDIGREELGVGTGLTIGMYSAPRSIVDAFRMRHLEGEETALEALKSWLRRGGQPSELLRMAGAFAHAEPAVARTLSVLL